MLLPMRTRLMLTLPLALAVVTASCTTTTAARQAETIRITSPAATSGREPPCVSPHVAGLQSMSPGSLIGAVEITDTSDPDFPAGARAWRVLYVSTGRDNSQRTLVCGVVVAPSRVKKLFVTRKSGVATGRVIDWDHGTLGVTARCQPSASPAEEIWGPPPYGINAVSWGSAAHGDAHVGTPQDGILQGMINSGWIVTATDYYDGLSGVTQYSPYVLGKIEAANGLDIVRAASFLLERELRGYPLRAYHLINWGHSQGGNTALWAGQLTTSYLKATSTRHDPPITLSGVVAEAPGGNFITRPGQAGTAPGYGLLDWVMHTVLQLTGLPTPIAAVAFFNSYLLGPWSSYSEGPAPKRSEMPAYPATGRLQLPALLTPDAITALPAIADLCWTAADAPNIVRLTSPFAAQPFYLPPISDGATINGFQHGNLDHTCASDPPQPVAALCSWLTYNLPGPLGTSRLSKLPADQHGALVPMLIANGNNDEVVHCVTASPPGVVPDAKNCTPTALYDAYKSAYCPAGRAAKAYLAQATWQPEAGVTTADHSDITGLIAAASTTSLRFEGSPLQRFMNAAFAGTLHPGCSSLVVNK